MRRKTISIDDHKFVLASNQNMHALQKSIVRASRHGGDFVDLVTGSRTVKALITPGSTVVLEEQDVPEPIPETGQDLSFDPSEYQY